MIEITKRNGIWEAYHMGGLMAYDEDLLSVLKELESMAEEIEAESDN